MPGDPSSFLFLVAMPGAPSSVLAPSTVYINGPKAALVGQTRLDFQLQVELFGRSCEVVERISHH